MAGEDDGRDADGPWRGYAHARGPRFAAMTTMNTNPPREHRALSSREQKTNSFNLLRVSSALCKRHIFLVPLNPLGILNILGNGVDVYNGNDTGCFDLVERAKSGLAWGAKAGISTHGGLSNYDSGGVGPDFSFLHNLRYRGVIYPRDTGLA